MIIRERESDVVSCDKEVTGWVKIEMQLERGRERASVLEIDERATSKRRVGLEPARLKHANTF